MYERHTQPLATRAMFFIRVISSIALGWFLIGVALFIGMLGYHGFEKMLWVDAFDNAAMILSGMGPVTPLHTTAGKLFAGCYALFSGLAFILLVGVVFAPVIHRFFHKMHLDVEDNSE